MQKSDSEHRKADVKSSSELYRDAAPASDDPARGQEVWASLDRSFEAPAKEVEKGHLYIDVEEIDSELASGPEDAKAANPHDLSTDRRNFMKLFGAATLAGSAACVRRPVEKAIPYVNQPVDIVPGRPTYYASTCGNCAAGCGIMVKTREGRPAKIEGLPGHKVTDGALCNVGQGSIQGLYHPERLTSPKVRFAGSHENVSWEDAFQHLAGKISEAKNIGILTGGSTGHRRKFFEEWLTAVGSSPDRLYTYDPNSLVESQIAAYNMAYGVKIMPRLALDQADLIVGIGTDFLDIGTSRVFHLRTFTEGHAFDPNRSGEKMGRFVQFEGVLTLTGGRADERHVIAPGSELLTTLLLVRSLYDDANSKGSASTRQIIKSIIDGAEAEIARGYERLGIGREVFDALAHDLLTKSSVVLCGSSYTNDQNATHLQLAAIMANELIGSYGNTLHVEKGPMLASVNPGDMGRFLAEGATLDALFVIDLNPVFSVPQSFGIDKVLQGITTVVSIQDFPSEVDSFASHVLPGNHYLESWGDEQPVAGFWSSRQPAVRPLTASRQAEDILLFIAAYLTKNMPYADYRAYLESQYQAVRYAVGSSASQQDFFKEFLHRGYVENLQTQAIAPMKNFAEDFAYQDAGEGGLRLITPLDVRLYDGRFAHLPILQEVGDPLSTVAWDSYAAISPETAKRLGIKRNDLVEIEGPSGKFKIAVYPMPGLHHDAIVVNRGNGHGKGHGTIESGIGVNPLVATGAIRDAITGSPSTSNQPIKISSPLGVYRLAAMQKHNDIANRTDIVKTQSLAMAESRIGKQLDWDNPPDLYPTLPSKEYRWGMSVDLSKCTGCGACMVACAVENNVPQVGRDQILMGREMHWIRLDRYFSGPVENPTVTFQPMLCQQCNHAPCEAVCPVFATNHDPEGVNAMTYNRCIGTRYCANACPYKVRRFNWWTHRWGIVGDRPQDRNPRALNPDVTVRTRGVMEKCNFCYQRLRDAKHRAKLAGRSVRDGEIQTACSQTCPSGAITFGNLHDETSRVAKNRKDARGYLALNGDVEIKHYGLKTIPNLNYMARVVRKLNDNDHTDHHG